MLELYYSKISLKSKGLLNKRAFDICSFKNRKYYISKFQGIITWVTFMKSKKIIYSTAIVFFVLLFFILFFFKAFEKERKERISNSFFSACDFVPCDKEAFADNEGLLYKGKYEGQVFETPPLLFSKPVITEEDSLNRAEYFLNLRRGKLKKVSSDLIKNIRARKYDYKGFSVSVSERGGYLLSLSKERRVEKTRISESEASYCASSYLQKAGYKNTVYLRSYEKDNIAEMIFAYCADGIVVYTDIIRVRVALDNGEVLKIDASEYLVNHRFLNLDFSFPFEKAKTLAEKSFTVDDFRTVVVPVFGDVPFACYEFTCKDKDGKILKLYINSSDGEVEGRVYI